MAAVGRATSRPPTLRDVASLAGVSAKTAARVVNGEAGVRADKVEAVRAAVAQLDYRGNHSASSLRRADGRTAAIGALLEDLANPFSAEVLRALEDAAHVHDVLVFAGSLDEDPERERRLLRAFVTRRADALVLAPASEHQGYLDAEVPPSMPVVFVDRSPSGYRADAVVTDNEGGAHNAVDHLIRRGHRRIGYLGDLRTIATARDRHAGYQRAMGEAGRPVPPALERHDLRLAADTRAAVLRMLDDEQPPTALFTAQNLITVGAIEALQSRGLQHDVAVVGFDDFPLADLMSPGITVVAQDPAEIGRKAGEVLFDRLAGDASPTSTHVVPSRLVERGSGEIRPPAGSKLLPGSR